MSLAVERMESREAWDTFLHSVHPHTFLHDWNWGEFNARLGNTILRLGVYDDTQLVAVALLIHVRAKRGSFLLCPHGPVFSPQTNVRDGLEVLARHLHNAARELNCQFVRFCPLLPDTLDNQKIFTDLGFHRAPIHTHPELSHILDLRPSPDNLLENMRKTTRYSIRKAQKDGVQIVASANPEDLSRFWDIYKTTVGRQRFTPFTQEYLREEFLTFTPDQQARWYFARYQDEDVAAAMIITNAAGAYYLHGASLQNIPQLTASHLLQWQAILDARDRGCLWYNFWGVVPETATRHPWAGLSLFKRGFGGIDESYIHSRDLPLSWSYWLTYTIERARKFKRGL